MSNLIKCKFCGRFHEMEEMYKVNPDTSSEFFVCYICVHNREIFRCNDCDNYYTLDYYWGSYDGNSVCDNCRSLYFVCENCNGVYLSTERNYDEDSNEELCNECMDERRDKLENLIEDYCYKPDPIFFGESEDNCYLGVELEVDNTSGDYDKKGIFTAADTIIDDYGSQLYLKHDGSLQRGFEIVSHPCTLDYHYSQFEWQDIMQRCKDGTLRSHDTSTCGLHVHLSRGFFGDTQEAQDLHISKLIILISKFYDSHLLKFSRRHRDELRWCSNPSVNYEDTDDEHTIIDKIKHFKSQGRYMAVNLQNQNTVEFRLFKGTLNFNTFMASIQLVIELSRYAIHTELKRIPSTSWRDIFVSTEYKELKNYLQEKELM